MKIIWKLSVLLFFITACGDVGKVLRNEKISTTDEFLVKKKGPLVLPPDLEKIPEPGAIIKKEVSEQEKLKKILKSSSKEKKTNSSSSSIEKSIIEKIRK